MNKKILIGSIIAVVILVLVSFTGVVGFQSVKSTSALNSPLFNIRTSRALDKDSKDISTDYLGHGEETNLQFSGRIKRAEQVQKAVDIISKMDDKAFRNLIARIINQEQMDAKETIDALKVLHQIRKNPNDIKNYFYTKNKPLPDTNEYPSCGPWQPGCIIYIIYENLLYILFVFATTITNLFSCFGFTSRCVCLNN